MLIASVAGLARPRGYVGAHEKHDMHHTVTNITGRCVTWHSIPAYHTHIIHLRASTTLRWKPLQSMNWRCHTQHVYLLSNSRARGRIAWYLCPPAKRFSRGRGRATGVPPRAGFTQRYRWHVQRSLFQTVMACAVRVVGMHPRGRMNGRVAL